MMPDTKTVTRALRYTIKMFEPHSMINVSCNDYFTDMLKDALDVIEDQSRTILQLNKTLNELLEKYQELNQKHTELRMIYGMDVETVEKVVRCRDCIWYHEGQNGKRNKCNYHGGVTEKDRYCWWGESDA